MSSDIIDKDYLRGIFGKPVKVCYRKPIDLKVRAVNKYGDIGKVEKVSVFNAVLGVEYTPDNADKENVNIDSSAQMRRSPMKMIETGLYINEKTKNEYVSARMIPDSAGTESYYIINGNKKLNADDEVMEGVFLRDFLFKESSGKNGDFIYLNIDYIDSIIL